MRLGGFLLGQGGKRREAGVFDCATLPADWAVANGWPDPMARWRGRYASEEDGEALVATAGGLLALFKDGFASIGLEHERDTTEWRQGDVGVVSAYGHEAGSIYTGRRWVLVAERGLAFISLDPPDVAGLWKVARDG